MCLVFAVLLKTFVNNLIMKKCIFRTRIFMLCLPCRTKQNNYDNVQSVRVFVSVLVKYHSGNLKSKYI